MHFTPHVGDSTGGCALYEFVTNGLLNSHCTFSMYKSKYIIMVGSIHCMCVG